MNLLLSIDDAVSITMQFLKEETDLDDKQLEELKGVMWSEMEQKCYVGKECGNMKYLLSEINTQSIANEIAVNNLDAWCTAMQVELQRELIGALKYMKHIVSKGN